MKKMFISRLMAALMITETVFTAGVIVNPVYAADDFEIDFEITEEESLSTADGEISVSEEPEYSEDSDKYYFGYFAYEYITNGDKKTIKIVKYNGGEADVVIPSEIDGVEVTNIGESAFVNCFSLKSVEIPNSVTELEYNAFAQSGLESVVIPESVKKMGERCFGACEHLTSVTMLANTKEIPGNTFYGCKLLKQIDIPENVTKIGEYAFWGTGFESIIIPKNIKEIGDSAFGFCKELKKITIEDGVQKIGKSAFEYCTSVKKIVIPDSVTYIGGSAFSSCESLENVTLSKNIKAINEFTFSVDQKLKKVEIPYGVTVIKDRAFNHCDSITTITVPGSVTKIENMAFLYCLSLKKIIIPSSVKKLGPSILFGDGKAVIYGKKGSTIEKYAKANNYKFAVDNVVRIEGPGVVKKGKSIKLKLENAGGGVSWKSSDKNTATVNKSGTVKGKKNGTVTITATCKGKKYTKKINVR